MTVYQNEAEAKADIQSVVRDQLGVEDGVNVLTHSDLLDDIIETLFRYSSGAVIVNRTQGTLTTPASSSGEDHYTALAAAMAAASDGDKISIENISADAGSNTLTISKAITITAKNAKITRSGDSDYLCQITATGEVTIEGLEFDGGRDNASSETWTTNRGEILRIDATVTSFIGRTLYLHDNALFGSLPYGILSAAKELRLYGCRLKDAAGQTGSHIRHQGRKFFSYGHHSEFTLAKVRETTITAATQANPVVITSAGHGWPNGKKVHVQDVAGMTELNNEYATVANATTDTFELSGVDSSGYSAYSSGGTVGLRIGHLNSANASSYSDQIHSHHDGVFTHDNSSSRINIGVIDNDTNTEPLLVEFVDCLWDAKDSTYSAANLKLENGTNTTVKLVNVTHIGDSLGNNAIFLSVSGADVIIDNCSSPGTLNFPNTVGDVVVRNSKFGIKSDGITPAVISGITTSANTHRATAMDFENVEFHGLSGNAFSNSAPTDSDQRITYRNLTIYGNSSTNLYLANNVTSTHHYTGSGLVLSNVGAGDFFLANTSPRRLMMSRTSADPKQIMFGVRTYDHPDSSVAVGYGVATASSKHPIPAGSGDEFPGVTGFLGDLIINGDAGTGTYPREYLHNGTDWGVAAAAIP